MFAKRHYEAIAEVIQTIATDNDKLDGLRRDVITRKFAELFARDNGQFHWDRFLRACRPGANVRAKS